MHCERKPFSNRQLQTQLSPDFQTLISNALAWYPVTLVIINRLEIIKMVDSVKSRLFSCKSQNLAS